MTQNTPSPLPVKLPTREQAALAIAIIRSKPSTLSVRDYILQLRAHVRQGSDSSPGQPTSQYLDLVAYWQDQCRRTQDECDRLQSMNIKLERSARMLRALVEQPSSVVVEAVPKAPGKKTQPISPTCTRRSQRKAGQQKVTPQSVVDAQDTIETDSDFLDALGDDGASLAEALFTTHSLCRAKNLDSETLCLSLVKTSSALGKVIGVVACNYEQLSHRGRGKHSALSLDQDKSDFSIALSVCAKAFMSILVGTSKLACSDTDNRLPSLIICELVGMFKCALDAIQAAAHQTSQLVNPQHVQSKKGRPKECAAARALAHLLIGFLGQLDKANVDHQKLFDGFVFILLERVGKQLYYCTFGHHRSTTIEGNILPAPEAKDASKPLEQDSAALAVRLEVKALILVLERAMGLAPNHMNSQSGRTIKTTNRLARTLSTKNLPIASRARLSPLAKARLQRTLIACMYGDAVEDEFLDVLTKPVPAVRLGSLQNVAKVEEKDVEEWYKQEVWRLVGWDVLAKEGAW